MEAPYHQAAAAAARGLALALAAAMVMAWQCAAAQQAAAPDSGPGCMPELVSLNPCMDYMSGNATTPDGPCCSAVSGMLRSSPACLCMVVGGTAASLGVAVDGDRALRLPASCKVQAPPASQCNSVGVPMPSPAPAAPTDANGTPAVAGSKATPASTLPYSDGNDSKPGTLFVFAVAALSLALLDRI